MHKTLTQLALSVVAAAAVLACSGSPRTQHFVEPVKAPTKPIKVSAVSSLLAQTSKTGALYTTNPNLSAFCEEWGVTTARKNSFEVELELKQVSPVFDAKDNQALALKTVSHRTKRLTLSGEDLIVGKWTVAFDGNEYSWEGGTLCKKRHLLEEKEPGFFSAGDFSLFSSRRVCQEFLAGKQERKEKLMAGCGAGVPGEDRT